MNENKENRPLIISQSAVRLSVCCTPSGELLPPSYIRDRGPNSGRGPVWVSPSENTIVASDLRGQSLVGIVKGGRVRKLPDGEAYKVWVMLRTRYDTDQVFKLFSRVPVSRAAKKLHRVEKDFPGVDLGKYVRIVRTVKDLPEAGDGVVRMTGANWLVSVVTRGEEAAYTVAMPVGKHRHQNGG